MAWYKVDHSGSTHGAKSGNLLKYNKDEPIEVKNGDLGHVGGAEKIDAPQQKKQVSDESGEYETSSKEDSQDSRKPTEQNTKKEIKKYMDAQGIDYNERDTKKELLEKLNG